MENRKIYTRNKQLLDDEIYFDIDFIKDHENKYLVERIEIKDKKKFIRQYKFDKTELNYLIKNLEKRNVKIKKKGFKLPIQKKNVINNKHPEYMFNKNTLSPADSYKHTIYAKKNYKINKNNLLDIQNIENKKKIFNPFDDQLNNYSSIIN